MQRHCLPGLLPLCLTLACPSTNEMPEPSAFQAPSERRATDPRAIVFYNESVEIAELEIFAPLKHPADCRTEAPHRLLCPADYRHLIHKRVYPRTRVVAQYPKQLKLDNCAQVWVRVHSKVMRDDENRQAIFLLLADDDGISLELGEGNSARLTQRKAGARNSFPPPTRYCPLTPTLTAPKDGGIRSEDEIAHALREALPRLRPCCEGAACRGTLKARLKVQTDGAVHEAEAGETRGQVPQKCLLEQLRALRFSGFTAKTTSAEVNLRLPLAQ